MATNWYWCRIRKNMNRVLCDLWTKNRITITKYLRWCIFHPIDKVLTGLQGRRKLDLIRDWNDHEVFSKFTGYIVAEERRLKTTLRRLSYDLSHDDALHISTQGVRAEEVCLSPLSVIHYADSSCKYVPLKHVIWTMDVAQNSLVSPKKFSLLGGSIMTVVDSMHIRANQDRRSDNSQHVCVMPANLDLSNSSRCSCSPSWTAATVSLVWYASLRHIHCPHKPTLAHRDSTP